MYCRYFKCQTQLQHLVATHALTWVASFGEALLDWRFDCDVVIGPLCSAVHEQTANEMNGTIENLQGLYLVEQSRR